MVRLRKPSLLLLLSFLFLSVLAMLCCPGGLWTYADPSPDGALDVGWPMFRRNPAHAGYTVAEAPNSNHILWTYTTGGDVESSPVIADGVVFFGSEDNRLYAINVSDGSLLWRSETGGDVESTPAVVDGRVFVGSEDGGLHAFNTSNGAELWSFATGYDVYSSPAVVEGRVYVGSSNGSIYALNATTGEEIWRNDTGGAIYSSPAVDDGRIFVGSYDGKMYALGSSGTRLWAFETGGVVFSSPSVGHGRVFFGSEDGYLYALNASSGGLLWRYETGGAIYSSPAVHDGVVYIGSTDFRVYALNETDGSLIWSYRAGGPVNSPPSIADHKVFFGSADGKLHALRESNGGELWSSQTGGEVRASPAIAEGLLVVGSRDHKVYCFSEDEWPMFRHDDTNLGHSTNPAPNTNHILWRSVMGDRVLSSPTVLDGRVFVGSDDHKVHALNLTDGKELWSREMGGDVRSTPAAYSGMVFVGSENGSFYALNAKTGVRIWSITTGGAVEASPTVSNGRVYFGSGDNNISCVDAFSGSLVWNYTTGGPVNSTAAVRDGVVYVGSSDRYLYALNASSGAQVWNYSTGGILYSSPTVSDGRVFVGSTDRKVYALSASDGRSLWNYSTGGPIHSSPGVFGGNVYVGSDDGYLYSIRTTDGRLNWRTRTGGKVRSSPSTADGKVFVGSHDRKLYALDAGNGTVLWSYETGWHVDSSPAIVEGIVLVGSWDQRLYAFSDIPLIIDNSTTLPNRSSVGSPQRIGFHARWSRDATNIVGGTIYVNNRPYRTNGSGWIGFLNSSSAVGRSTWNVTGVEADDETSYRQDVGNLTTVWDRVNITLTAPEPRIDPWENATVSWRGAYEYDNTNFTGQVTLNDTLTSKNRVERRAYSVASITDSLHNITSFASNTVTVTWDRVVINLNVSEGRIDAGENASISWTGWYEYDNTPFEGAVTLNDTAMKSRVGGYTYTVENISDPTHGLTSFRSNTVSIIFDRVSIDLSTPSIRVDVGSNITLKWRGWYEYDNSTFSGTIRLNDNRTSYDSVGTLTYYVTEIVDRGYGLTGFTTNRVNCTWDRLKVVDGGCINTVNEIGGAETVWFKALYESDNQEFNESYGTLYVNGSAMSWSPDTNRWEYNHTSNTLGDRYFTITNVSDTLHGITAFHCDIAVRATWTKGKTSLQCSPTPALIEAGDTVTIRGRITPPVARSLTLVYIGPDGREVNRTIATGSEGSFTDLYQPTSEGHWTVKALWPGDERYEGSQAVASFQVRRAGLLPFIPLSLNQALLIGLFLFLVIVLVLRRKRLKPKEIRTSRIIALAATALILVALCLPIYSMDLHFSIGGFGDLDYGIEFSMLTGAKARSSLRLAQGLPLNVTAFREEAGDSAPLEALLEEADLPDVEEMAEEAGVPFDVTGLPIDINSMAATADSTVNEIPLLSSKASVESLLSEIPLASNILPTLLQFGPLLFLVPTMIGLARGSYGKTAFLFLILVLLPLIISHFVASISVTLKLGGYLLITASAILLLAVAVRRIRKS